MRAKAKCNNDFLIKICEKCAQAITSESGYR